MGSLRRGWGLRWSQGPPEMRLVGGAMGYGSTMEGCGQGALMWGLWAVLLLGADGSGPGPASRWVRVGAASFNPWAAGSQAQVDFELAIDWSGNRAGHSCSQASLAAHLLSSSEPTRHLLRQLSEKGTYEGWTATPT